MRTNRSRQKTFGSASRIRYVKDQKGNIVQTIHSTYVSKTSSIEDRIGNFGGINDCYHTTITNDGGLGTFAVLRPSQPSFIRNHEPWYTDYCGGVALPVTIPGGLPQFVKRGIQTIKPKLSADVSVPNFLIELREIKSLASSLRSGLAWLRGSLRKSGRKTDLGDVASDIHLSSSFGFNPLIGDLFKFTTVYNEFIMDWKNFKKHANRPVKSFYKENLEGGQTSTINVGSNDVWTQFDDLTSEGGSVNLTLHYRYSPLVNFGVPNMLNFAKYLGFRGSKIPNIVWNALPYSFVVDWVFKVSDFLDSIDDGVIPVRMEILAACWSTTSTTRNHYYLKGRSGYVLSPAPYRESKVKVYQRGSLDPYWVQALLSSPALPSFDGLSVKEVSLGIALGNKLRR